MLGGGLAAGRRGRPPRQEPRRALNLLLPPPEGTRGAGTRETKGGEFPSEGKLETVSRRSAGSRAAAPAFLSETRTGGGGGRARPDIGNGGPGSGRGRKGLRGAGCRRAPPLRRGRRGPQTFTLPPLRKFSSLVTSGPPQPMGAAGDILGGGRGGTARRALARPAAMHSEWRAGGQRSSGRERRHLRPLRLPVPAPPAASAGVRARSSKGSRAAGGSERLRSLQRGRFEFPVISSAGYLPGPGGAMRSGGGCFGDCRRF